MRLSFSFGFLFPAFFLVRVSHLLLLLLYHLIPLLLFYVFIRSVVYCACSAFVVFLFLVVRCVVSLFVCMSLLLSGFVSFCDVFCCFFVRELRFPFLCFAPCCVSVLVCVLVVVLLLFVFCLR